MHEAAAAPEPEQTDDIESPLRLGDIQDIHDRLFNLCVSLQNACRQFAGKQSEDNFHIIEPLVNEINDQYIVAEVLFAEMLEVAENNGFDDVVRHINQLLVGYRRIRDWFVTLYRLDSNAKRQLIPVYGKLMEGELSKLKNQFSQIFSFFSLETAPSLPAKIDPVKRCEQLRYQIKNAADTLRWLLASSGENDPKVEAARQNLKSLQDELYATEFVRQQIKGIV